MYTNGFTGQRYSSIVAFRDAQGRLHTYMHQEFLAESEQVTLHTLDDTLGYDPYNRQALVTGTQP